MPARKPCNQPGCPNLQPCEHHAPKPWATSTRRTRVGSGSRQQKRARYVMHRDGAICHICGQPGADEVDHVIPTFEGGPDHITNLAPIHATPCHRNKTQAEAQRARGNTT